MTADGPAADNGTAAASADRRILFVHAHPDDESIGNGATMARLIAEGAHVTLVTCTMGEEGEVIPADLNHLTATRDDTLGTHRAAELAAAMRELGVRDHRFLGGPGRYRDSGMMGAPTNTDPRCFWQADLPEAADLLVRVVRETRPHVLVTYDTRGGYGHPDHIQAHRVAVLARTRAADPDHRPELGEPWHIGAAYWNCVPRSAAEAGLESVREDLPGLPFTAVAALGEIPGVVADDLVSVTVDAGPYLHPKRAAMRAHATQILLAGGHFALSNGHGQPVLDGEHYLRADPQAPSRTPARSDSPSPSPSPDLFWKA
ncbi:N-acetyl-1-D-myo-inositol-2-amino-2-deoxy-alpha-D-glucopyranoside deacetylase [Streptomyces sp. NPDC004126]|uniref:N-acetyl-1-D-myo-inositol-2-amino-2-deoxy-alpha- D-glucopyranoside deacetylase n=1 Tax=Streptomyces sp. NPDC004126 TaxID=3390695 RepID=UPI003D03088E